MVMAAQAADRRRTVIKTLNFRGFNKDSDSSVFAYEREGVSTIVENPNKETNVKVYLSQTAEV